jgi:hypothetical protein
LLDLRIGFTAGTSSWLMSWLMPWLMGIEGFKA